MRVQGEVEYAVPPLAEPEAVELFCARSQLEPDDDDRRAVPAPRRPAARRRAGRCPHERALAGADPRASLQRLDLLKGGRDADPRQQTLRATIEWSYELLSPEEQQLFARLSVFAGGCTLEAAEEVCDADLDTLQSLVEKSLLRFTDGRYWMLETIREYAARAASTSQVTRVGDRERLRRHVVEFAYAHGAPTFRDRHDEAFERIEREHANVRTVMDLAAA